MPNTHALQISAQTRSFRATHWQHSGVHQALYEHLLLRTHFHFFGMHLRGFRKCPEVKHAAAKPAKSLDLAAARHADFPQIETHQST